MKNIFLLFLVISLVTGCSNPNEVTENLHVYGNCMMCEETIEGSLKGVEGITVADWSWKTKQMILTFDSSKVSFAHIKEKIATSGYDMEDVRAQDSVYSELHRCCKYKRPE